MSIIAPAPSEERQYHNVPEGRHLAVLADVVDLGWKEMTFAGETKVKHRIRLAFETDNIHPEKPEWRLMAFITASLSMHEKSTLRKHVEALLGRKLKADEIKGGYDLETLIGTSCELMIEHNVVGDKTYANIAQIIPLRKGDTPLAVSEDFVRAKDREDKEDTVKPISADDYINKGDNEIPF